MARRSSALLTLALLAACGGSVAPSSDGGAPDASGAAPIGGGQPPCAPCDPSLDYPCQQGKDICRVNECDLATRRCVTRPTDAGLCFAPQLPPPCP